MAIDTHVVLVPSPAGPVPTPTPMPFLGELSRELCVAVFIDNQAAATEGSKAVNSPAHVPAGGTFQRPPSNEASVHKGSARVFFDGRPAARSGDPAVTCNDPEDAPKGTVVAVGTVFVGG
ncbi:PAAR domain-containing protein [Sorangium sp. So ce131]|uniref:PAAR domain-containing protein n=1 Tax=Sorangium sp. So ce131 TaxID=3133282 RepID=UPI003F5DAC67